MVERQGFSEAAHRDTRAHAAPVCDVHIDGAVIDFVSCQQTGNREFFAVDGSSRGGRGAAQGVVAGLAGTVGQGQPCDGDQDAFSGVGAGISCSTTHVQCLTAHQTRERGCAAQWCIHRAVVRLACGTQRIECHRFGRDACRQTAGLDQAVVARIGACQREAIGRDRLRGDCTCVVRHIGAGECGGRGDQAHHIGTQLADAAAVDGGRCIAVVDLVVDAHAVDVERQRRDGGGGGGRCAAQHIVTGLAVGAIG